MSQRYSITPATTMQFVRLFFLTYLMISAFWAYGHSCHSNRSSVLTGIKTIIMGVENFKLEFHRYPTTSEGLEILVGSKFENGEEQSHHYFWGLPEDPWGNVYQYRYPGVHNTDGFDLWTYGADGKPGGHGDNADCGNWQGDDCYKEPYEDLKNTIKILILLLLTPIFWLPVYLVFSVRNLIKMQPRKAAFYGWHLWVLLASLAIPSVLLVLPFTSGC